MSVCDGPSREWLLERVRTLEKINSALMDRVERSVDSVGDAYALFESNIVMQGMIAERTLELEQINNALKDEIAVRRAAEDSLRAAKEEADAANHAKSDFLANMSHEIRTPMTAIMGYADLATEEHEDRVRLCEHLDVIKRSGMHLLTIINDILDLSKLDAGKMPVFRFETDLCAIASGVAEMLRVQAERKGLDLLVEADESTPAAVMTDPARLRQILLNLVGNAIKFTERGSVRVRTAYDDESGVARVVVTDTGIGIDAASLPRIFDPFHQADESAARRHGGTGLGLSIAQRFAGLLGGDIVARSTPGVGSEFVVSLRAPRVAATQGAPLLRAPEFPANAEPAGVTRGGEVPDAARGPLGGLRVLLAEDGPDNQRLLSFILGKAGADVTVAEDGRYALEAVQGASEAFDLILMDMQMPRMDGYAATRAIKQLGFTGPVIALTAHAMAGDRERCLGAGCDDYLTKPIDRALLINGCLSVWLGNRTAAA